MFFLSGNMIKFIQLVMLQITVLYLKYASRSFTYYHHLVNVISLSLSQSDHIKQFPLCFISLSMERVFELEFVNTVVAD